MLHTLARKKSVKYKVGVKGCMVAPDCHSEKPIILSGFL